MPKFCSFLNIDGRLIEDWSGRILPNLDVARLLAEQEFPRLSRIAADDNGASLIIEIRDEDGRLIATVSESPARGCEQASAGQRA
jgi:hypothetical protein